MLGWLDIAVLVEMKDFNGSFVAAATPGLPFLLRKGMTISLIPPVLDAPRTVEVAAISSLSDRSAKVRFAEIDSPGDAEKLLGCHCIARAEDVGDIAIASAPSSADIVLEGYGIGSASDLVGWKVADENGGILGSVGRMEDGPAHPFLVLSTTLGSEAMVPFVSDFVVDADSASCVLTMRLPKGLLEV